MPSSSDKFEEIHKDSENSFDKLFAGQVLFDQRLDCNSPMEFRYYTKRFGANPDPVCFYCGSAKLSQSELEASNCSDLKEQYKHVFPVCSACGKDPYTSRK